MTTDYERGRIAGIEAAAGVFDGEAAAMHADGMDIAAMIFEKHAELVRALLPPAAPGAGGDLERAIPSVCAHREGTAYGGKRMCMLCGISLGAPEVATAHIGDPCRRCGTPHDDVAPGPCPAPNPAPAAAVADAERALIEAVMAEHRAKIKGQGSSPLALAFRRITACEALDRALASSEQKDGAK